MSCIWTALLALTIGICVAEAAMVQTPGPQGVRLQGWKVKCDKSAPMKSSKGEDDCFKSCKTGSCMFAVYNSKTRQCGAQPMNSDCSFDHAPDNMIILGESKKMVTKGPNAQWKGDVMKTKSGGSITPAVDFGSPIAEADCKGICALLPECKVVSNFMGHMVPEGLCSLYAANTPGKRYGANDNMGANTYIFT